MTVSVGVIAVGASAGGVEALERLERERLRVARELVGLSQSQLATKTVCVPKLRPRRSSCVLILMDDSAETVLSVYGKAVDPVRFEGLGPVRWGAAAASGRWVRCML